MISISQEAASQIRGALGAKGIEGYGLRVQIVGGGCEGFLYDLMYVDLPDPEDRVFESEGLKIFVHPRSLAVVEGLTIDHGPTPHGPGFVFHNPRAHSRCSCGASFST